MSKKIKKLKKKIKKRKRINKVNGYAEIPKPTQKQLALKTEKREKLLLLIDGQQQESKQPLNLNKK